MQLTIIQLQAKIVCNLKWINNMKIIFLLSIIFLASCSLLTSESSDGDECAFNTDCALGETCNTDLRKCEVVWLCIDEADCYSHDPAKWNHDENPVICRSGACVAKVCKGNSECPGEQICSGGKCVDFGGCQSVASVKIVSLPVVLTQGTSTTITSAIYNSNGVAVPISPEEITYKSATPAIVAAKNSGLLTGGTESGASAITAHYESCSIVSEPLTIQNYATLESGKLRVILRNIAGESIPDTTVNINGTDHQTNESGYLVLDNTTPQNTISIFNDAYQYTTLYQTEAKDVILYLQKRPDPANAGGFKGSFDFSQLPESGTVKIGIAGGSLPGNVMDLELTTLLGESIMTPVKLASIDDIFPIPSSLQAVFGGSPISAEYKIISPPGKRIFWGWGGKLDLGQITPLISEAMGSDQMNVPKLINQAMPYLTTFHHAVIDNQNIIECARIPDIEDINGNEDTTDLIPDFNNNECFPVVNLKWEQSLSLESTISFPPLKKVDGTYPNTVLVIPITSVTGSGMVPMGLGATGSDTENFDGKLDDFSIPYAPQYNGLEGNRSMMVLLAMPISITEDIFYFRNSGIIAHYPDGIMAEKIDLSQDTFLGFGEDAKLTGTQFTASPIKDASLYRIQLTDADGKSWMIYSDTPEITVPQKPASLGDPTLLLFQGVQLRDDATSNISLTDLITFNNNNMDQLGDLLYKFSSYEIPVTGKK